MAVRSKKRVKASEAVEKMSTADDSLGMNRLRFPDNKPGIVVGRTGRNPLTALPVSLDEILEIVSVHYIDSDIRLRP